MNSREQLKETLKAIILQHLKEKGIDPKDSTRVIMESPGIWEALCKSGKMPRQLTYGMMMSAMTEQALKKWYTNIF